MKLKQLQRNWDEFGKNDPFWAILTDPEKKGNKWEIKDFFETGKQEINSVMKHIDSLKINLNHKIALDFGCGAGRVTQALADHFDRVYGVDIAPSMIDLANNYNRFDGCKYFLNETDDLKLFNDNEFDFIYTNITLQHMEPRYFKKYLKEFLRVLAPKNSLLVFELPYEQIKTLRQVIKHLTPNLLLSKYRNIRYGNLTRMEKYGEKKETVIKFLKKNDARVVDIKEIKESRRERWISFQYYVNK